PVRPSLDDPTLVEPSTCSSIKGDPTLAGPPSCNHRLTIVSLITCLILMLFLIRIVFLVRGICFLLGVVSSCRLFIFPFQHSTCKR
ncbi:hypothetical protein LINPERHAP1_LOCUS18248, partial [Linum perenne]